MTDKYTKRTLGKKSSPSKSERESDNHKIMVIHKNMTENQCYENIKKLHKEDPETFIHPDEWLRLRRKMTG